MARTKTKLTVAAVVAVMIMAMVVVAQDSGRQYVPGTVLLQTRWGDGQPYNSLFPATSGTPLTNPNSRGRLTVFVDCGTTAMAQIMRFHEWPQIISGNIPGYTTPYFNITVPEIVRQDFRYDWASMKNVYARTAQGDSANAVATLIYHSNVAMKRDFGMRSFGGDIPHTALAALTRTFRDLFDYDRDITYLSSRCYDSDGRACASRTISIGRSSCSGDTLLQHIWGDILRLQIDSLLPVILIGERVTRENRTPAVIRNHVSRNLTLDHVFILDGYNDRGEFHINASRGGEHNGWHRLANLPLGANANQHAIINIAPANRPGTPDLKIFGESLRARTPTGNLDTGKITVNNGEFFFISPTIYNIGRAASPAGAVLGVALYTSQNQFRIIGETTLDSASTFCRARNRFDLPIICKPALPSPLEMRLSVPSDIPAGDYTLRAVMKNATGQWELMGAVYNYINEITISVTGTNDGGSGYRALLDEIVGLHRVEGQNTATRQHHWDRQLCELLKVDTAFAEVAAFAKQLATEIHYDWEKAYGYPIIREPGMRYHICEGYAQEVMEKALSLNSVQAVEYWLDSGDSGGMGHVWNVLRLVDGRRLFLDLTWFDVEMRDSQTGEIIQNEGYDWANLTFDEQLFRSSGIGYSTQRAHHQFGRFVREVAK